MTEFTKGQLHAARYSADEYRKGLRIAASLCPTPDLRLMLESLSIRLRVTHSRRTVKLSVAPEHARGDGVPAVVCLPGR